MANDDTEHFRKMYNKLHEISASLLPDDSDQQDRMRFALCLAEFYSWSNKVNNIIEEFSSEDFHFEECDLSDFSEKLYQIKIALYLEIVQWLKDFRIPRDRIEALISDRLYGEDEEGCMD